MIRKNIAREVSSTIINDIPSQIQRITSNDRNSSIYKDDEIIQNIIQRLNALENEIKELNYELRESLRSKLENYDETLKDEYLKNNLQEQRLLQVEIDIKKLKDKR